ncbi:hypothetical protein HanPI659440_Chr09g0322411 [Helianthus annuus]|nr:hypothetical protein HanPI659440_Chr09g0322411 [Helianthus annuus]
MTCLEVNLAAKNIQLSTANQHRSQDKIVQPLATFDGWPFSYCSTPRYRRRGDL